MASGPNPGIKYWADPNLYAIFAQFCVILEHFWPKSPKPHKLCVFTHKCPIWVLRHPHLGVSLGVPKRGPKMDHFWPKMDPFLGDPNLAKNRPKSDMSDMGLKLMAKARTHDMVRSTTILGPERMRDV